MAVKAAIHEFVQKLTRVSAPKTPSAATEAVLLLKTESQVVQVRLKIELQLAYVMLNYPERLNSAHDHLSVRMPSQNKLQ